MSFAFTGIEYRYILLYVNNGIITIKSGSELFIFLDDFQFN